MKYNYFNFINIIRHSAALSVIYIHSFELMKYKGFELFRDVTSYDVGYVAVNLFFFLSGVLIFKSANNSTNTLDYLFKRFIRIFPPLFVCIILTTLVFFIISDVSFNEFFSHNDTKDYLLNIILIGDYRIPYIFDKLIYPYVANGSLWTLRYEVMFYIITTLFLFVDLKKSKFVLYALFSFCLYIYFFTSGNGPSIISNIGRLGSYFFLGSISTYYSLYNKKIFLLIMNILVILSIIFLPLFKKISLLLLIGLNLKYFLDLHQVNEKKEKSKTIKYDISYGIYIYAFPVQQILLRYFEIRNVYVLFIYSTLITTVFAIISWEFLEKRLLRYKYVFK